LEVKMTRRATDVIGKPIVSADTGRKLGTVGDLLLDDHGRELTGLIVHHGLFGGDDVLPAGAVQSFGGDAVVSRSDVLLGAREWRERDDPDGERHRHDSDGE
jgi:uncharacterized protein YrrD